jgi:hypothetical protein
VCGQVWHNSVHNGLGTCLKGLIIRVSDASVSKGLRYPIFVSTLALEAYNIRGCHLGLRPSTSTLAAEMFSMAPLSPASICMILSCVAGLHLSVLNRFEFDHLPFAIIALSSTVYAALIYFLHLDAATVLTLSFWGALCLWVAVYRICFHPLRNYPGPFFARLWKWWSVKQVWDTGLRFHRTQQRLQKRYGDYVRTGN